MPLLSGSVLTRSGNNGVSLRQWGVKLTFTEVRPLRLLVENRRAAGPRVNLERAPRGPAVGPGLVKEYGQGPGRSLEMKTIGRRGYPAYMKGDRNALVSPSWRSRSGVSPFLTPQFTP